MTTTNPSAFRRAGPWRGVLLAAGVVLCAGAVQAQCYTVYDSAGAVVYESPQTPVDLRQQLGDTVPPRFGPGATMVFTLRQVDSCGRSGTGGTSGYQADAAGLRPSINAATLTGQSSSGAAALPSSR